VGCAPLNQESVQRYYRKNRLATEIQGQVLYSVFEHDQQLLAQQQHQAGSVDSTLLATDLQRSVLHSIAVGQHQKPAYSPYGHSSPESGLMSLLGFNGERRDPVTGHYLLGNGYRAFNPVLMRFNCPDSLSPFGMGGVNAYAYCVGDPVNLTDQSGHIPFKAMFSLGKTLGGRVTKSSKIGRSMPSATKSRTSRALGKGEVAHKLRSDSAKDLMVTKLDDGPIEDLVRPGNLGEIQQEVFNTDVRMLRAARERHSGAFRDLELARAPILRDERLSSALIFMGGKGFPESSLLKQQQFEIFRNANPEAAGAYSQAISRLQDAQAALNFAQNNYLTKYPTLMHNPLSNRANAIRR
jgi:RHS repeat-associated protein